MDKCKEIKDLILTDYIDAQLDIAIKEQVENHLHQCAACQVFAKEVKSNLVMPFQRANRQQVPEHLWQGIQEKIQQQSDLQEGFLDRFKEWLSAITLPQLVPVLCSVVMVLFIGSMVFLNQQTKQAQHKEQVLHLASVLSSTGTMGQTGSKNFGTPIETYFL